MVPPVTCACATSGEFAASPTSTRFNIGDIVDVSGVGGPYEVVGEPVLHEYSGRWLHPCRIPLWHPQAPVILEAIRQAATNSSRLDPNGIGHYPGTHLRRHVCNVAIFGGAAARDEVRVDENGIYRPLPPTGTFS